MRASLGIALALLAVASPARASEPEAELEKKASRFSADLRERHLSPEGLVLYRIDLETWRRDLERGTYSDLADGPTFTGLFAATACTRALVEGPEAREARADAEHGLAGLRLLMDVTGVRGLLARSVRRDAGTDTSTLRKAERWKQGAAGFERYVWRSDVSADQYANGLLPAVAACAALFPERTRALVTDFASHLVEHDYHLIEPGGERTRFGDLSWRSGFGLNSIFQLTAYAALAWAVELDPDPTGGWASARDELRDRYRTVARARRTNVRVLGLTNPSNDLMAWNLYRALLPLVRRTGDPVLADLRHGLHRAWLRVRGDDSPYFAAVLCQVEPESCDRAALARGLAVLAAFPLDKRKRVPNAAALQAIPTRWLPGRKRRAMARALVPIELRPTSSFEWKSSPYRVTGAEALNIEYTGLDFLAAYWLYRAVVPTVSEASVERE